MPTPALATSGACTGGAEAAASAGCIAAAAALLPCRLTAPWRHSRPLPCRDPKLYSDARARSRAAIVIRVEGALTFLNAEVSVGAGWRRRPVPVARCSCPLPSRHRAMPLAPAPPLRPLPSLYTSTPPHPTELQGVHPGAAGGAPQAAAQGGEAAALHRPRLLRRGQHGRLHAAPLLRLHQGCARLQAGCRACLAGCCRTLRWGGGCTANL